MVYFMIPAFLHSVFSVFLLSVFSVPLWFVLLNKLRHARQGHRRNGQRDIPGIFRRREIFLGIQGHVPGNDLPGVRGHAAHDGQQRALGHVVAVVDRLAGADAGE